MTWAQWVLEYNALMAKETAEMERSVDHSRMMLRAFKTLMVGLLGLKFTGASSSEDALADANFVPLSLLTGQPEVLKHYMEEAEKEAGTEEALQDEAFEEFSAGLHKKLQGKDPGMDLGDIEPLLSEPPTGGWRWNSVDMQEALQSLGVKPRDPARSGAPHIMVNKKGAGAEGVRDDGPAVLWNVSDADAIRLSQAEEDKLRRAMVEAGLSSFDGG